MLRGLLIAATVVVGGCPSAGPPEHPRAKTDDTALRIRIARAEAKRAGGVDELIELVTHGDTHVRVLAIRGLGRIGGPQAMRVIESVLADRDDEIATAAARAIGVAGLLDEITPDELDPVLVKALDAVEPMRCAAATCVQRRLAVIETIGRAGGSSLQARLARDVGAPDVELARASAFALGRYGRRKRFPLEVDRTRRADRRRQARRHRNAIGGDLGARSRGFADRAVPGAEGR